MLLWGENGAGKSTLMKVLTGILYKKIQEQLHMKVKKLSFHSAREAQDNGVYHRTPGAEHAWSSDSCSEHLHRKRVQEGYQDR